MAPTVAYQAPVDTVDVEECNDGISGVDSDLTTYRSGWIKRVMVIGAGMLLAGTSAAAVWGTAVPEKITVRELLDGPDMADVATKNIVKVGIAHPEDDEKLVHITVAKGLKEFTRGIKASDPELYHKLNTLVLSKGAKDHIIQKVGSLSEPRVQKLGEELALAAHESKHEGSAGVTRRLQEKLRARLPELRRLRDQVMPNAWHVKRHVDEMRIVSTLPESSGEAVRQLAAAGAFPNLGAATAATPAPATVAAPAVVPAAAPGAPVLVNPEQKLAKTEEGLVDALGVVAALTEQARVALDQTDFIGEAFGKPHMISPYARSAVGAAAFSAEVLDCTARAKENKVKLDLCPLKYASAGADALECLDNLAGMDAKTLAAQAAASTPPPAVWGGAAPAAAPAAPATPQ